MSSSLLVVTPVKVGPVSVNAIVTLEGQIVRVGDDQRQGEC